MLARSRVGFQAEENTDGPNGDDVDDADERRLGRCGIEPARKRLSNEDLPVVDVLLLDLPRPDRTELPGRNGLVEGVGLDGVFVEGVGWLDGAPEAPPKEGNWEGTVPARLLRELDSLLGTLVSFADVPRSGKVSSPGDSGIVSLRGVERPLAVGGPHKDRPDPSDCNSRALSSAFISSLIPHNNNP